MDVGIWKKDYCRYTIKDWRRMVATGKPDRRKQTESGVWSFRLDILRMTPVEYRIYLLTQVEG